MTAGTLNITVDLNAAFSLSMTYKNSLGVPIDLTGYDAKLQVRHYPESTDPVLLEMSVSNSRITLGGTAGTIVLALTLAQVTAILTWRHTAVYDLLLTPPGQDPFRFIEGAWKLSRGVTS